MLGILAIVFVVTGWVVTWTGRVKLGLGLCAIGALCGYGQFLVSS